MIHAGIDALAKLSPALEDPNKAILPSLWQMREVSRQVAVAVANAAREEGLMGKKAIEERGHDGEITDEEVRAFALDHHVQSLIRIVGTSSRIRPCLSVRLHLLVAAIQH